MTAVLSLLTRQASKEGEGRLWRSWPCKEVCLSARTGALLQPSGQLSQTASVRARELRETGEPMGGLQHPSRDLTFSSDSLMNSGVRSWAFEEVIMLLVKKKIALDCAVHVYTTPNEQALLGTGAATGKTHFKELFIHRRSWKDVFLDHAEEWKLLKSRMP